MGEETRQTIIRNLTFIATICLVAAAALSVAIIVYNPPVEAAVLVTPFFTVGGGAVGGIGVAYTVRSETSP